MNEDSYRQAKILADGLEAELKRLNRWTEQQLPAEKFENMGAFGSNTMTFEQWLQFILLPRLQEIIETRGEFPQGSQLSVYAARNFDGDQEATHLQDLLFQLDKLVEEIHRPVPANSMDPPKEPESVSIGDEQLPQVIYSLLEVLPQFEGADLESQLQTYDTFLTFLSPAVRPELSDLLLKAAEQAQNLVSRERIKQAAHSIASGGRATGPP